MTKDFKQEQKRLKRQRERIIFYLGMFCGGLLAFIMILVNRL
jgi:predicted nucleotide-binding protein